MFSWQSCHCRRLEDLALAKRGLAWLLTFYGVALATASSIGLVLRLLTNIVHLVIFLAIMLALNLSRTRTAAVTHS